MLLRCLQDSFLNRLVFLLSISLNIYCYVDENVYCFIIENFIYGTINWKRKIYYNFNYLDNIEDYPEEYGNICK